MNGAEDTACEKHFTPPDEVPQPICSTLGKHYIHNPQGNACVKCKYYMQWFRWDYGEHKYIPL